METLKNGKATLLPGQIAAFDFIPQQVFELIMPTLGLWMEDGSFDFHNVETLNDKFPEIKTIKAKEMIEQAWKKS